MALNPSGHPYTSPEDRDKHPLCGSKKRSGGICRAYAGQGTEHFGIGRCKYHGGNTPNHRKAAIVAEAKREMVTLGRPLDVTPDQALKGILRATAGHVAWLAMEVAALDGVEGTEARTVVSLYGEERDRLTRIAKACTDSGMTKREVEFTEEATATLAKAIDSAFLAVDGLTKEHRRQFGQSLRMELAMLQQPVAAESVEPTR